jgi:hypothetical protein
MIQVDSLADTDEVNAKTCNPEGGAGYAICESTPPQIIWATCHN